VSEPWTMSGRFLIEADSEEEAQRAFTAIERAAKRASAVVTIHIHGSEARDGD
jgi:hypothetical protein